MIRAGDEIWGVVYGTEFGCEWTSKTLTEAQISDDAREKILHRNATAMMSRLAEVAQRETVAA